MLWFLLGELRYQKANLSDQGRQDMFGLGQRLCFYWPGLCHSPAGDGVSISVETTFIERTQESAYWFLRGMGNLSGPDLGCCPTEITNEIYQLLTNTFPQLWVHGDYKPSLRFFASCKKSVFLVFVSGIYQFFTLLERSVEKRP